MNKKAMANIGLIFWKQWAEAFFIILIILGFLISISIQSPALNYLVIFCAGLWFGRTIYSKKGRQSMFPFFLIVIGFLIGYLAGGVIADTSIILMLLFFIVGSILSYYIHKKGYIK